MSLDLYFLKTPDPQHLDQVCHSLNVTHNLNQMAMEAGIYNIIWRPEEVFGDNVQCRQLEAPLRYGIGLLISDPDHYKQFNPPNGWGDYDGFMEFLKELLWICIRHPNAYVHACR